jgi:hypothetical protein
MSTDAGDPTEGNVKVHVTFSGANSFAGESLWASPVAGEPEHYTIDNIPFFAYGLNLGDVVRCVDAGEHPREIVAVIRPSGSKTLRVMFEDGIDEEESREIIDDLKSDFDVKIERAMGGLYCISLPPNENFKGCFAALIDHETREKLSFETCEQRVEGSFGDAPEEHYG